jgi:hypothetical protein
LARDDFSRPVIDILKARVANRCSNPNCRVPTSAPSENNKANNIGIAAHICAASPGGARYDGNMSADERKSINNAIWLCSNCSIDIDRDIERHSVAMLKNWKERAEDTARAELGMKLPSHNETIDTVAAALTGLPKSYIAHAISNVHQASEKSLVNLDPRFLVKTSHCDGKTSVGIYAKENVQCSMKISGESAKQFLEKYQQLLEHGKDLEIESDSIVIEGSDLLREVFETSPGVFGIASRKMEATQKLWLVQKDTNQMESYDDILGDVSFGTKSFTFEGFACDKLFKFGYQKSFDENDDKVNITMTVCWDQWEGVSVKFLPFFDKLHSLFERMTDGWELFTSLEVKGDRVLASKGIFVNEWEYVLDTASFLHYVACSKIVIQYFEWEVPFTSKIAYTSEEHRKIFEVASVVEGKQVYDRDSISGNATGELVVDEDCANLVALGRIDQLSTVKFVVNDGEEIMIFGILLTLPRKIVTLNGVLPKVRNELGSLKKGDVVSFEFVPQESFSFTIGYES